MVFVTSAAMAACGTTVFKCNLNSAVGQGMLSIAIHRLVGAAQRARKLSLEGPAGGWQPQWGQPKKNYSTFAICDCAAWPDLYD